MDWGWTASSVLTRSSTELDRCPTHRPIRISLSSRRFHRDTVRRRRIPGPGVGDPVRDGKFEFTVTKLDCSKSKVGSEFLNETAQGKFCIISVTVKNIGKEAQIFDGSSQKAYDAGGTEFSNDTSAEIYANEGSPTFLQEINPGNQVKGKLIFDVPKSTKLTSIELHDSMFSGGVKVSLS